jgi:predicted transcriptional regulator
MTSAPEPLVVRFDPNATARISRMAERTGVTPSDLIGQALRLYEGMIDRLDRGDIFHATTPDGETFRVEFDIPLVETLDAPDPQEHPGLRLVVDNETQRDRSP